MRESEREWVRVGGRGKGRSRGGGEGFNPWNDGGLDNRFRGGNLHQLVTKEKVIGGPRKQNQVGFYKHLEAPGLNFFFTNIPDSHGTAEMWEVFAKCRSAGEVFIPPKRDKKGNRFGFVRFIKDSGGSILEEKLKNVWIGNYKVITNKPRYNRMKEKVDKGKTPLSLSAFGNGDKAVGNLLIKSWKEALTNGNSAASNAVVSKPFLEFYSRLDFKNCFMGELLNAEDVVVVKDFLIKEGEEDDDDVEERCCRLSATSQVNSASDSRGTMAQNVGTDRDDFCVKELVEKRKSVRDEKRRRKKLIMLKDSLAVKKRKKMNSIIQEEKGKSDDVLILGNSSRVVPCQTFVKEKNIGLLDDGPNWVMGGAKLGPIKNVATIIFKEPGLIVGPCFDDYISREALVTGPSSWAKNKAVLDLKGGPVGLNNFLEEGSCSKKGLSTKKNFSTIVKKGNDLGGRGKWQNTKKCTSQKNYPTPITSSSCLIRMLGKKKPKKNSV
ncbi:unnamed protein product [Lupinus luteus]|uniref:RRM domain-containing protein n=1 Tax=Lupinus luteus TaxID=3873 RepID=A0AAV1WKV8_LUPLU